MDRCRRILEMARAPLMGLVGLYAACGTNDVKMSSIGATSEALTAITLSGHLKTSAGLPIVGVTVQLAGSRVAAKVSDSAGAYQFTGLSNGSYSLRPDPSRCQFVPDVVNLNNLTASANQDFVGSGASCPVGNRDGGTPEGGAGDAGAGPAFTCTFTGTNSGDSLHFSTRLACPAPNSQTASCVPACLPLSLDETLSFTSSGAVESFVITNGNTQVFQMTGRRGLDSSRGFSVDFFGSVHGIQHIDMSSSDGQTYVAVLDGRSTAPFTAGTPADQIRFADGGTIPVLAMDSGLSSSISAILAQASQQVPSCLQSLPGVSNALEAPAAQSENGHQSGTAKALACQLCRGRCDAKHLICFYGVGKDCAASAGIFAIFGPFSALACVIAEESVCFDNWDDCLTGCQEVGPPEIVQIGLPIQVFRRGCCPVGCGGEDLAFFDYDLRGFVGCCNSDETCLDRKTRLCCSAGTTPCNGTQCCSAGEKCVPTNDPDPTAPPEICCGGPGETACGRICCINGQHCLPGGNGCCIPCTADSQCGGGDFCINGCCVNG